MCIYIYIYIYIRGLAITVTVTMVTQDYCALPCINLRWFPSFPEMVPKFPLRWFPSFQVATTCFSCSPPELNFLVTNICVRVKQPLPPGEIPIAVNKYNII